MQQYTTNQTTIGEITKMANPELFDDAKAEREFLWTAASGQEKKIRLINMGTALQIQARELARSLEKATPAAKQLLISKEIEKLGRQLEKVQMGLQELIL